MIRNALVRRFLLWLGLGILVIAAATFATEYVLSDYVRPTVSGMKWAALVLAIAMIALSHRRKPDVSEMHLPH